ncbi:MAG TPA: dienelactone hydrolase family protein [Burkholderiales bacterium]|nr:dienelactone hydrolase family protein [Burkholderiales bacterium]
MRSLILVLALTGLPCLAAERVEIPTAGLSSSPEPLVGHLFLPETRPHAAIVMMHGCGGAYTRSGALNSRHAMWGEYLQSLGYAVLMLDSFTSRGLREICTVKNAERTIKEADRVGDAYAAHAYLRERLGIDSKHIGLLGWSHGGGTVLNSISRKPANAAPFAAAVAFYPGCRTRAKRADTFHPYAPLIVLIGEADDWTPAAPCKTLIDTVSARGEPASIVVYPGAYHDFDNPTIKARVRTEVPNGARPGEGVTIAPDPKAREDAKVRVKAFFEKHLE